MSGFVGGAQLLSYSRCMTPGFELYPSGSCSAGGPGVCVDRAGRAACGSRVRAA